jgi:hypothetical protein
LTNFIALYRGPSVAEARLIAVSSEPRIVDRFMCELAGPDEAEERGTSDEREPLRIVRGNEEQP